MNSFNIKLVIVVCLLVQAGWYAGPVYSHEPETDAVAADTAEKTLNEQLAEIRAGFNPPAEVMAVFTKALQDLRDAKITESAIQQGDMSPDFSLSAGSETIVELATLLESGPVVLLFVRGGW